MKTTLRWAALFLALVQMGAVAMLFNAASGGTAPAAAAETARPVRVVAFGDSLTAGYGLSQGDAFPAQLERALKARGVSAVIANAGVSGDTSGDGLRRLDWSIPEGTQAVIVELGANDALRGIDPELTRSALDKILGRLAARKIRVLLAGMKAPANWGADYAKRFDAIYPELASKHGAELYPFFLDGVIGRPGLNLPDGLHPQPAGVAEIVRRILPAVEKLVASVPAS